MKKIFGMIISLLLIAGSGVGVYYVVKESNVRLDISVENIEVYRDELQVVEYSCSIDKAEIFFEVSDTTVAKVAKQDDKFVVKGLMVGETVLKMTAKYNKYKNFSEAIILVKEKPAEVTVDPEIEYNLNGVNNFEIDDTTITMKADDFSLFSVVSDSGDILSFDLTCSNSNVNITKKTTNKTFKIICSEPGTYSLIMNVNGYNKNFTLVVEETESNQDANNAGLSNNSEESEAPNVNETPETQTSPEDTNNSEGTNSNTTEGNGTAPICYTLNINACSLKENTITMTHGTTAIIQIVPNTGVEIESWSISTTNNVVTIEEKIQYNMAYKIKCVTAGRYIINISVNGVLSEYILIVE